MKLDDEISLSLWGLASSFKQWKRGSVLEDILVPSSPDTSRSSVAFGFLWPVVCYDVLWVTIHVRVRSFCTIFFFFLILGNGLGQDLFRKLLLKLTHNSSRCFILFRPLEIGSGICGEGNGNPLHCSCLENPRDGGAWWAAVYGVTQSRTQLKRLSSSSSGIYVYDCISVSLSIIYLCIC